MSPAGSELLLGQGPNPYGGGYSVVFLVFLILMLTSVGLIVFVLRRQYSRPLQQKLPRQRLRQIAGCLLGCMIVATTTFLIDVVTTELEFSERIDVSDNGQVTGGGIERSEAWYRVGRVVHVFSMLGFLALGVMISVRMHAPFFRNGVSWGLLIAAVLALLAG